MEKGVLLDIPTFQQAEGSTTCGPVCLQMVLSYFGREWALDEILQEVVLFGEEQFSTSPQLGCFLLDQGFQLKLETINPYLFSWDEQGMEPDQIRHRLEERKELFKGNEVRMQILRQFLEFMDKGGEIIVSPPNPESWKKHLEGGNPLIALLTTRMFSHKLGVGFNYHFQVIRGMEEGAVHVNDPGELREFTGHKKLDIKSYLYALAASASGDIDNGSVLYIKPN